MLMKDWKMMKITVKTEMTMNSDFMSEFKSKQWNMNYVAIAVSHFCHE
jgi:hypothetical protein